MKTSILIFIIVLVFSSCSDKDFTSEMDNKLQSSKIDNLQQFNPERTKVILDELSQKNLGDWWRATKKFVKSQVGTYLFNDCNGSNPCGPCPGVCLRFGIMNGDIIESDSLSAADQLNGLSTYALSILENKTTHEVKVLFETQYDNDFLNSDALYFVEETAIARAISSALNKSSISIQPGIYSVVYEGKIAYTILDVKIN